MAYASAYTASKHALLGLTRSLARPHELTLVPFYQIVDQRYSVYWKVLSESEWATRQADAAEGTGHGRVDPR